MKLNLYRGIYTDAEHAELIRRQGIDEKWYIDTEKLRVNHDNIDEFLSRDSLQWDDVVIRDESSRIIFGCGTYRDACYYAYRNATQGGYAITAKERASEQFSGPKEMFVFSFQVPEEDVFIDANDFLYPICYFPERIKGLKKKQLCKVFGEEIIDKYKVDRETVYSVTRYHKIPKVRDGKIVLFLKSVVDKEFSEWIETQKKANDH